MSVQCKLEKNRPAKSGATDKRKTDRRKTSYYRNMDKLMSFAGKEKPHSKSSDSEFSDLEN
jgi:hypothetical protein